MGCSFCCATIRPRPARPGRSSSGSFSVPATAGRIRGTAARRRSDIFVSPLGVGVALAFDFCYAAWPEDFRTKVAAQLEWKARDLVEGLGREEYNDNYPSNHVAICQGAGGVVALALLGEPGEYFPKPPSPTAELENAIEAPNDYRPGKGVPVVKLELGQMPRKWLFAGPLKPEDLDREFLADLGGREKARPEVGTKIAAEGRTVAFEPLDEARGIWNSALHQQPGRAWNW